MSPETPAIEPQSPHTAAVVWERDDWVEFWSIFPIFFRCDMMEIKQRWALNIPRLECLPLTRALGKKKSRSLSNHSHPHTHTLSLHLWWFKPWSLAGVEREGIYDGWAQKKQSCLKITPTERMHTCVCSTRTDTQRRSGANVYLRGEERLSQV